jgi:hypothetical protein
MLLAAMFCKEKVSFGKGGHVFDAKGAFLVRKCFYSNTLGEEMLLPDMFLLEKCVFGKEMLLPDMFLIGK